MQEQNFEDLLNDSFEKLEKQFEPGEKVTSLLISQDNEHVYFDIGGKSEALVDKSEFSDSDDCPTIDETKELYIVGTQGGEILATSGIGRGFTSDGLLMAALDNQYPVYGSFESENDGGYTIKIGEISTFCPKSHLDQKKAAELKSNKNKKYQFYILEKKKRNYIVSNRLVLQKEREQITEKLIDTLEAGDLCKGIVTRVESFGIFVKLDNGLEGLVPRSELSRSRSVRPEDFSIGDRTTLHILSLDWENNKHSFSIKSATKDPWDNIGNYFEGNSLKGLISNMIKDGAFVELEPGLEGFIHKSRLSKTKRINKPEDVLAIGQEVDVEIISIDQNKRRIGLELITGEKDPWSDENSILNTIVKVRIEAVQNNGLAVRLETGMEAFIPVSELINRNSLTSYTVNDKLDAVVLDSDPKKKRTICSEKQVGEQKEKENMTDFMDSQSKAENTATLGTMFGDILKNIEKDVKKND